MKRALLLVFALLFSVAAFGQFLTPATTGTGTTNYIAKWSSSTNLTVSALCQSVTGGSIGIGTCAPTQKLQVNSGDMLVKGLKNFTLAGQVARYYVGDTNHIVGAAYGAGLFFNVYKIPYAMVVQDQSGYVGIGTSQPGAQLDVETPIGSTGCVGLCPLLVVGRNLLIDNQGVTISGHLFIDSGIQSVPFSGGITIYGGGITFLDGTVQTTAYKPTSASTNAQLQVTLADAMRRIAALEAKTKGR